MYQTRECLIHGAKQKPRFLLCEPKKATEGLFQHLTSASSIREHG